MKNLLKQLPKKLFAGVAAVAIIASVASTAMAGFGPNRETRAWTPAENGFDHVTFNSYTGVTGVGDERDFLRGVQVGRDSVWSDPVNGVDNNAEVEMKIYIHNNADPALNDAAGAPGVAHNVTVKATIPTGAAQAQQVNASISASNATPGTVTDTLDLTGANSGFFELAYVPGSAKVHEGAAVTTLTAEQEQALTGNGYNMGDQKGCFQYVREITFRVKVKMPSYQIQKTARLNGEGSDKWRKVVNAKVGDKVDYRIWFNNSGTTNLKGVKIVDNLPPHVTVVPGSMKSYKGSSVVTVPDSALQANGTQINVDSGEYYPGDDSYLVFTVTINNDKEISCGVQQINNVAYATPDGYGALNDHASVNVVNSNECSTPTYACTALATTISGLTVTSKVTAPVSGGAVVKTVTFNYGDGSTPKVTNSLTDSYTFKAAGTYKISATVVFTVNGTDKSVSSDSCATTVTVGSTTPPVLPNTGAGSTIGIFAAISVAGAVAHNLFVRRRAMR